MALLEFRPDVRAALDAIAELAERNPASDVPSSRDFYRAMAVLAGDPELVHHVEDRIIDGPGGALRLRLYRPGPGVLPAALFIHGGWFFMGDLDTHDAPLRAVANAAGCVVVAVDYRLAPEHPFPAAADDCSAAAGWLAAHAGELGIDRDQLAVCGDSAGGTLAAVLARRARDTGGPTFCRQVLVYPVIDPALDTASWKELTEAPIISRERAELAWSFYTPDGAAGPDAAPSAAADHTDLPPTLVITAEYDPLRDEGEEYGEALRAAGVPVTVCRYPGMIHGFFQMAGMIEDGVAAIRQIAAVLRESFDTAR